MNIQELWGDRINQMYSSMTVAEKIVRKSMYHEAIAKRSKCKWYHYFKKKRLDKIIMDNESYK